MVGSTEIFTDDWIDKEENSKLFDLIFSWLLDLIHLDLATGRKENNVPEMTSLPNMETLSQTIKICLQGVEEFPSDFYSLFDLKAQNFTMNVIFPVISAYHSSDIPHQPLTLIAPQFEAPLPKLIPSSFPPSLKDPAQPHLELFDLDENFANQEFRVAQLTNKCTGGKEDLEFYVSEAGNILQVSSTLQHGQKSAKHIIFSVFNQIVLFKRSSMNG